MPVDALSVAWRATGTDAAGALLPVPALNPGFFESKEFAFAKPGAGWRFRIDDEPLNDVPGQSDWLWSPGFFAGEVTAELVSPSGTSTLYLLDVAPDPTKIGRDVFQEMVQELLRDAPSLVIGSEPAASSIGDLGAEQDPWLEFARLRRHAPGFLKALSAIAVKPRRALVVRRTSEPLHRVRSVDRHTATALARSATVAALFTEKEATSLSGESRLNVPFVAETFDSSANRAMLALLLAVSRRTRALEAKLEAMVEHERESDTRTALRGRWPARKEFLSKLGSRLTRLLRRPPWTAVTRAEVSAAGLNAVSADPIYARAWGVGWRALRHGIEGDGSIERLWLSPSWEIYERWCFVRLGRLLSTAAPDWNWRPCAQPHRYVGHRAEQIAELRLQPTFRSRVSSSQGLWSISKERVPDLLLTVREGQNVRFAVLDAKYRASRVNVLDAMESAHIYQDSLRIHLQRPNASVLLIPAAGGAPWLEQTDFQMEHRVGCHPFCPGAALSLPLVVLQLLKDGSAFDSGSSQT